MNNNEKLITAFRFLVNLNSVKEYYQIILHMYRENYLGLFLKRFFLYFESNYI